MKYLVTGGSGFVGSHMIDYLLTKSKDSNIFVIKRWRSSDKNISHLYNNKRVVFIEADLLDRGSINRAVQISRPDVVYHFASESFPQASFIYPVKTLETNVVGTTNLLEELRIARDLSICNPMIISVSSSEVYGDPLPEEVPIKESNPIRAANPYSISKVGHDLISQYYQKAFDMKIVITRLFSHEGKRRGREFALSSFAYQIVQHELSRNTSPFVIKVGNLQSVRTYFHIDDAIKAYYLLQDEKHTGEIYNIGGSFSCTVGDALNRLFDLSIVPKEDFLIEEDPERVRPTDITLQIPDCSKFISRTNWRAEKTLDDILTDLLDYWRTL